MGGPPIAISGENGVVSFEEHRFPKTVRGYHPFSYYNAYLPKDAASIGSRTPPPAGEAQTLAERPSESTS